jgi:hypothetical protein
LTSAAGRDEGRTERRAGDDRRAFVAGVTLGAVAAALSLWTPARLTWTEAAVHAAYPAASALGLTFGALCCAVATWRSTGWRRAGAAVAAALLLAGAGARARFLVTVDAQGISQRGAFAHEAAAWRDVRFVRSESDRFVVESADGHTLALGSSLRPLDRAALERHVARRLRDALK